MKKISVSVTLRPAAGCGATVTVTRSGGRHGGAPCKVGITWRAQCESPPEGRPGSPGRPEDGGCRGSRTPQRSIPANAPAADEE